VVSVTTYRDAGFLPEAFINFLCLLGWSPKNDREQMSRQELIDAFSLEGINRANAVVNFKEPATTPEETFDPKAVWLNAEHIRGMAIEELSPRLLPIVQEAGFNVTPEKMLRITPLIRERIKLLRDVLTAADFFFVDQLQRLVLDVQPGFVWVGLRIVHEILPLQSLASMRLILRMALSSRL
jgi:glutamyl-tRNA synthetase